jgi:hypothetical protein
MAEHEKPPSPGTPGRDYEVGYGKPPRHTRFQPGRSPNPKGRPKRCLSLAALVERELDQKIVIKEGGRPRELSRREVIAKQLVKKALEGHDRSIVTILKLVPSLAESFGREAAAVVARRTVLGSPTEDAAIIASFLRQMAERVPDAANQNESDATSPEVAGDFR